MNMEDTRIWVRHKTKVVSISAVNLVGKLQTDKDTYDFILEKDNKEIISLEGWLDKFIGKKVRILIEDMENNDDDTNLLKQID